MVFWQMEKEKLITVNEMRKASVHYDPNPNTNLKRDPNPNANPNYDSLSLPYSANEWKEF
jgi:hypothetical protein